MLADYSGFRSSRERNLVDLVVLATTHAIDKSAVHRTVLTEAQHRYISLLGTFEVPLSWGIGYANAAESVRASSEFPAIEEALNLVRLFLDPVLDGRTLEGRWFHERRGWSVVYGLGRLSVVTCRRALATVHAALSRTHPSLQYP